MENSKPHAIFKTATIRNYSPLLWARKRLKIMRRESGSCVLFSIPVTGLFPLRCNSHAPCGRSRACKPAEIPCETSCVCCDRECEAASAAVTVNHSSKSCPVCSCSTPKPGSAVNSTINKWSCWQTESDHSWGKVKNAVALMCVDVSICVSVWVGRDVFNSVCVCVFV